MGLTARKLRSLVCYDPDTGLFVAKIDTHKGRWKAGRKVGNQSRTGVKGVSRCKATGKFRADITVNRKRKNLGRYNSVEEAQAAYLAAAADHFGEFARSG